MKKKILNSGFSLLGSSSPRSPYRMLQAQHGHSQGEMGSKPGELGPPGGVAAAQPSLENKSWGFFGSDGGFLAKRADPSPSTGACQAALISPSSGEDNACLGRVPSVTSARACQREVFALYYYQMVFVSSPRAGASAKTRGARRGEIPRKTPICPKIALRQLPPLQPHQSGEA